MGLRETHGSEIDALIAKYAQKRKKNIKNQKNKEKKKIFREEERRSKN